MDVRHARFAVATGVASAALVMGCPHAKPGTESRVAGSMSAASVQAASSDAAPSAVTVTNLAQPGAFEVANAGSTSVELASTVTIESQASGAWGPGPASRVALIEACGRPAPKCVRLEPGARLRPPAWSGWLCSAQCPETTNCKKNPYASGTHRFVVTTCDGTQRFAGAAFTNPDEPPPLKP
ncbi:hypothetical protein [Sorangium sp. So ce131]|uniref:hypothetical protein n=1 Tax=Sorangium sp. So ce131 TaxID=3133282 RepID=UPI003F620538